jgi:uncharacterized protein YodC (DUF2158 family)
MTNGSMNIGDIVHLKSGGPDMVVTGVAKHVFVAWHDEQDRICSADFPEACLELSAPLETDACL